MQAPELLLQAAQVGEERQPEECGAMPMASRHRRDVTMADLSMDGGEGGKGEPLACSEASHVGAVGLAGSDVARTTRGERAADQLSATVSDSHLG